MDLIQKDEVIMKQHYSPDFFGIKNVSKDFPVNNFVAENGKKTYCPKGRRGVGGEPGVPPILKTFRFTFGKEFTDELSRFSKIHQYDNRVTFKEAWAIWIKDDDISCLINNEVKRLTNEGFQGDIMDKMYKSGRYYYRKKSEEEKAPHERKEYVGFNKNILALMDKDIQNQLDAKSVIDISPSEAFDHYCANHKMAIVDEFKRENPDVNSWKREDVENMTNRFKKAYKNRFYKQRGETKVSSKTALWS